VGGRPVIALIVLCWALSAAASADDISVDAISLLYRPFEAEYRLTRNGFEVGQTLVRLELTADGVYFHRVETGPSTMLSLLREDLILEQSRGRMVRGRPRPDHYRYRRTGELQRDLVLSFDWEAGRVRMQDGASGWSLDVPPNALDKLIQQLAASAELAGGAAEAGFRVADGGLLKTYGYRLLHPETVDVPMGRFETLKVERRKDDKVSDYTLWMSPALGWQPVRILRIYRGTSYRLELESLDFKELQ
jgi:hypothetical protein